MHSTPGRTSPPQHERGAALITVVFVLLVVLVGGLAAVALTSGELESSRGHRIHATADACAQAAVERVRAQLPNASVTVADSRGTLGAEYSYTAGHYGETLADTEMPYVSLDASNFDMTSLYEGERAGNTLGNLGALKVVSITATCSGPGGSQHEVQLILRYGVPGT